MSQRRFNHGLRRGSAILPQQVLLQRTAINSNSNWYPLRLRRAHHLAHTLMRTDVSGIQAQLVDTSFKRHQREFVMEMNVGDERDIGYTFPDLFQCDCGVIVRHSETHDLASGARHLSNLRHRGADVSGIGLRHRLHHDRRAAADLDVFNFNYSRCTHDHFSSEFQRSSSYNPKLQRYTSGLISPLPLRPVCCFLSRARLMPASADHS